MKISNRKPTAATPVFGGPKDGRKSSQKKASADGFDPSKTSAAKLDGMSEGEMIKYQEKAQAHARLMQMKSALVQIEHDMKKAIIANFRV